MVKKPHDSSTPRQTSPPKEGSGQAAVEQLVTFQSEREFDLFSGEVQERLFLKLYVAARTSGLLAEISDRDWKTLCVLATYMNAEGFCHPSQAELARSLGCSRQMANERVNHLAQFRFHGHPVLLIVKDERSDRGTWVKNRYRVLPISQLSIFGDNTSPDSGSAGSNDEAISAEQIGSETVSRKLDTDEAHERTVSSHTVTVQLDTNKKQLRNQTIDPSNSRKRHIPWDETPETDISGQRGTVGDPDTESIGTHHRRIYDETRAAIVGYVEDFAREFNDQASLTSSVSRAYNLFQEARIDFDDFISAMYAARARTQERTASIRSTTTKSGRAVKTKMAFWFACLEDELGLRE